MNSELQSLTAAVQTNCHISDALYARDYTLCIYLLKMREYYRWEKGYDFADRLPEQELGSWLVERERLWQELEDREYAPITVDNASMAPFDSDSINARLVPRGLLYSAGYGNFAKPHFFLARLKQHDSRQGYTIYVADDEYARDITAPPAMYLNGTIYVRRESLRRMLWEKYEEWRWQRRENAMGRVVSYYPFERSVDEALDSLTDVETEAVILHELGEAVAGERLGPEWERMLAVVGRSRAEFTARAVRDHLADCSTTLPELLAQKAEPSLHFYFANLSGMRREVFPTLVEAYRKWCDGAPMAQLVEVVERGLDHWGRTADRLLRIGRETEDADLAARLEEAVESVTL